MDECSRIFKPQNLPQINLSCNHSSSGGRPGTGHGLHRSETTDDAGLGNQESSGKGFLEGV